MFNKIDIGKLGRVAVLAALAWPLVACVERAPAIQVAISGVESEAQLIRQLQAQGYQDIRVTEFYPQKIDPRPELMRPFLSADDPDAQVTPVHFGWNGTAVKDGRSIDVYVTRAAAP